MNDIPNDIPKYRKKSTASPPAKAKHKHVYEPCLLDEPCEWYLKPHERSGKRYLRFASYCPICGKTNSGDHERWWTTIKKHNGVTSYIERVHTEEAERELDPTTRTLPVFKVDEWRQKFVDIGEE
jgi:hypothetical protein